MTILGRLAIDADGKEITIDLTERGWRTGYVAGIPIPHPTTGRAERSPTRP
jgi:hypothetical protein